MPVTPESVRGEESNLPACQQSQVWYAITYRASDASAPPPITQLALHMDHLPFGQAQYPEAVRVNDGVVPVTV